MTLLQQPRLNVYTAADFEEKAYPAMTVTFQPKGYPSFFQPDHHDIADVGLFQDLLQGITIPGYAALLTYQGYLNIRFIRIQVPNCVYFC